jgi:hypothetical protein
LGGLIRGLAQSHRAAEREEHGGESSDCRCRHVRSLASQIVRTRYNNRRWT